MVNVEVIRFARVTLNSMTVSDCARNTQFASTTVSRTSSANHGGVAYHARLDTIQARQVKYAYGKGQQSVNHELKGGLDLNWRSDQAREGDVDHGKPLDRHERRGCIGMCHSGVIHIPNIWGQGGYGG
jgi:hypothetical protein